MPSGIILSSASQGATVEAVEKVLADHGYEADKPAAQEPTELVEPKRDDFETDEAFEAAQEEHEAKLEEAEQQREEQEEQERQKREQAQQGNKPSRRQRAVEKATKELRDELRQTKERLAALEGGGGKKPNEPAQPKVEELKAPKREEFKTDAEFEDAQFDYRYKLRRQKEATEAAKKAAEESQKALNERIAKSYTDYQSAVAAFKEEHDDWDKVVNQALALPDSVYYAIVDLADEGPAVTYYLGKNPAELERMVDMTPWRAAIEVGRIADKLKGKSKPATRSTSGTTQPKPRTQLPEPVRPVSTAATSTTTTSREAAQKRDFRAFKAAQRAGR